jgi:hypothetical protein
VGEIAGLTLAWNERFMVALPPQLVEFLLAPAPGDNPFAGVTAELRLSVWDGTGDGGMGTMLYASTVPLTFDWLLQQLNAAMRKRQAAAAAAAASSAAAVAAAGAVRVGDGRSAESGLGKVGLGTQQEVYLYDPGMAAAGTGGGVEGVPAGEGSSGSGPEVQQPAMKLKLRLSVDDSQVGGYKLQVGRLCFLRILVAPVFDILCPLDNFVGSSSMCLQVERSSKPLLNKQLSYLVTFLSLPVPIYIGLEPMPMVLLMSSSCYHAEE